MSKKMLILASATVVAMPASACPFCNKQIRDGIINSQFYPNLLLMCPAFIALAIVVAILARLSRKRYRANVSSHPTRQLLNPVPLFTTSMILGIGMGGFVDGIVLHQILQWHEMLSNKIPADNYVNKSINMFWDGVFHLVTWITTLVGIILLWQMTKRKDIDRSGRLFAGGLTMGWGVFNIVEGLIDHHLLKLHNVKELSSSKELWNYGFLGFSVLLLFIGWMLARGRRQV